MSAIVLRQARAADAQAIFNVHKDSVESQCGEHYSVEQIHMWLDGRSPATYLPAIEQGNLWVAQAGSILGFVEIDGFELSKLFVCGAGAGQGIGGRLLNLAIERIRATKASSVYLEATRNAQGFYQANGFVPIGNGTFSRGNSRAVIEIVKMQRPLQD